MPELIDLELGVYTEEDDREALALEGACIQGRAYAMSFRRTRFHRRAQNFPEWRIFTARRAGRLVGVAAAAVKEASLFGRPTRASFFFDARVHPDSRGRGIARRLGRLCTEWGLARAEFGYTYTLADNRIARGAAEVLGGVISGGYSYLVYPCFRRRPVASAIERSSFEETHAALLASSPPFDFYANPGCREGLGGYVGSWLLTSGRQRAGCSAWSNQDILAERIESVPAAVSLAGRLSRLPLVSRASWPHIPAPGEVLRSWYLFDFFATEPPMARDLLRHVAAEAMERGIDYCHIPHDPRASWVAAARADVPKLFAPVVPYVLLVKTPSGDPLPFDRTYVDVRDL